MRLLKVIKAILVNGIQPLNGAVIVRENQRKDNLQYRNQHHLLQVLRIEEVLRLHRFTMNTKCNIGAKTVLASQLRILNHVFIVSIACCFSASFTMTTMIVNEDVISLLRISLHILQSLFYLQLHRGKNHKLIGGMTSRNVISVKVVSEL